MEIIKARPYVSAELEIIKLECTDIITTSGVNNGGDGNGYVPDDNVDDSW